MATLVVPIVISLNCLIAKSFDQHFKKLSLGCWIKARIARKLEPLVVDWALKALILTPSKIMIHFSFSFISFSFSFMYQAAIRHEIRVIACY